ncbi:MAG: TRAP transporter large permease subunit, partial [Pseudomonadota bacterium]
MTAFLDLAMFAALILVILAGFPVAFSIAGVAVAFAYLGWALGVMDISLLGAFGQRVFGLLTNQVLIAIPLFVLMGALLEKSRIAEDLLETMGRAFGGLRGGLGISVIFVGALLAASTGIVGATVVAMGLIALPTMLRSGYDPRVASGIVCTAGTLGQIIPPSTLLIILADVMSNAYQQAQYEQGRFAVEALSVGQFFAAALFPSLTLVTLYLAYVLIRAALRPADMPAAPVRDQATSPAEILRAVLPPVLLILAVLGSILGGLATPTEAASVGAMGALLLAGARQPRFGSLILAGAAALIVLA